MHKDKENGIVMTLKFASTFFSITHFGASYLLRMFLFHSKLLFNAIQRPQFIQLAHF
jgi:hypothetical protein